MDTLPPARITASIVVPPTQNTAPVLEFRCLYTSDLRRKQKRWQDGILKFHTFNRRVMVYDDRGNFVGDTHWREDYTFGEGEELDLERSGTLVQVSDCIGKRDQDLTDLLEKRVKERGERVAARAVVSLPERKQVPITEKLPANMLQENSSQQRPVKRRKQNSSPTSTVGYAQSLTGATLNLSGTPASWKPLRYDTLLSQISRKPTDKIYPPGLDRDHLQCRTGRGAQGVVPKQINRNQIKKTYENSIPQRERIDSQKELDGLSQKTADLEVDRLGVMGSNIMPLFQEDLESSRSPRCLQPTRTGKSSLRSSRRQVSRNDGCQEGQHLIPLRITSRPKRKLLLLASAQVCTPLPTPEIVQGHDVAIPPPALQERSTGAYLSQATKRLETFYQAQQQRLNTRPTENRSLVASKPLLASPENDGIDYRTIDLLLTRNHPKQADIAEAELSEERDRHMNLKKSKEALMTAQTRGVTPMIGDRHGKESSHVIEKTLNVDIEMEEPLVIDHHDSPDTGGVAEKSAADTNKSSSRQSTRLADRLEIPNFASEEKRIFTRPIDAASPTIKSQDGIDPRQEQRFVARARVGNQKDTRVRVSKSTEQSRSELAIERGVKVLPHASIDHYDDDMNRDKGPWSREAFDLFGFYPKRLATVNPVPP